jgi:hypothetical protein
MKFQNCSRDIPIDKTQWAKRFRKNALYFYESAIKYANQNDLHVTVELRDDLEYPMYAIVVVDSDDFWMDAFDLRETAVELCSFMKWTIVE